MTVLTSWAVLTKSDFVIQPALMPMTPPIGPSRRVVQQITAQWPDRKETLMCVLELDKRVELESLKKLRPQ